MQKAVRHLADQLAGIRPGTLSVGFIETFRASLPRQLGRHRQDGERHEPGRPDRHHALRPGQRPRRREGPLRRQAERLRPGPEDGVRRRPARQRRAAGRARPHVKKLGEEAKVAVRAIRQDARKQIAARGRGSERAVQEATDAAVAEIERLVKAKTEELGA